MSRRTERIASLIKQEVATAILRDLDDPRLEGTLASVTRVKVAEDLSMADIYVVLMGTPGKQSAGLAALRHAAGLMRTHVGKAMHTRTIPYLRFHLDEAYRKEMEVQDLIRQAERERLEREGGDNAEADDNPETGDGGELGDPVAEAGEQPRDDSK